MRIRQVRPEYWSDETVARLADPVRLFYIGLWGVADDAGWLEWRPARIGALLYPYRAVHRRETDIEAWGELLVSCGRIEMAECQVHAFIPTLTRHQRVAGKQSFVVQEAHENEGREAPIEHGMREMILRRDGYQCRYCGKDVTPRTLVLEHVIPKGPGDSENLVIACRRCNWIKGSKSVKEAGLTLLDVPVAPKRYRSDTDSPVEEGRGRERNVVRETSSDSHEPRLKVVDGKWVAEA